MTYTTTDNITLLKSSSLTDWNNAEVKLVFNPPMGLNYSTDLWAPEIHQIDDSWYIIFTAGMCHQRTQHMPHLTSLKIPTPTPRRHSRPCGATLTVPP